MDAFNHAWSPHGRGDIMASDARSSILNACIKKERAQEGKRPSEATCSVPPTTCQVSDHIMFYQQVVARMRELLEFVERPVPGVLCLR
jgi:hypothetical protein